VAEFYIEEARKTAVRATGTKKSARGELVTKKEMAEAFSAASTASERRGDEGVRQREFLNTLHSIAEKKVQALA
jgi:hypothetical protein